MKITYLITLAIFPIFSILLLNSGCSSRSESPVMLADSTVTYPAKNADGILTKITLGKTIIKKTGKLVGEGTLFTIRENASVRAIVELENIFRNSQQELMFHLDWIDENGRSVFLKRVDLSPDDSILTLNSSFSISPEKRQPGIYNFRVYLFRELIAEKKFQLRPEYQYSLSDLDNILKKLTLCRSIDKTTGEIIGEDSVFIIKEKARVRGFAEFQNLEVFGDRELKFYFDWVDSIGTLINRKELELTSGDSSLTLSSYLPISPDVQKPGKLKLRLFLFEDLITEKRFELRNEPKITITRAKGVEAKIEFCKSINKKTGERKDVNTVFIIGEKEKVHAVVEIKKPDFSKDQILKFRVDWIGPNGKSFYKKQMDLLPGDSLLTVSSSISISPETRKPGKYKFRIYLVNDLVAEKDLFLYLFSGY